MTIVMPTCARTGFARSRARVSFGVLAAALGLSLMSSAPADAVLLTPAHLVSGTPSGAVDDAAVADPLPAAPAPVLAHVGLRAGDSGRRVRWVQRILGVSVTGHFGPATRAAVIGFQKSIGVFPASGVVGPVTHAELQSYGEQKAARAARAARLARIEAARKAAAAEAARKAAAAEAARKAAARAAAASRSTTRTSIPSTGGDPTMTSAARTSRSARQAVPLAVWRGSSHARMIVSRESGGRCTAIGGGGAYRGTWQMGSSFWRSFGGLTFASTPDRATCAEQDLVAYRGWIASWWSPWGG